MPAETHPSARISTAGIDYIGKTIKARRIGWMGLRNIYTPIYPLFPALNLRKLRNLLFLCDFEAFSLLSCYYYYYYYY